MTIPLELESNPQSRNPPSMDLSPSQQQQQQQQPQQPAPLPPTTETKDSQDPGSDTETEAILAELESEPIISLPHPSNGPSNSHQHQYQFQSQSQPSRHNFLTHQPRSPLTLQFPSSEENLIKQTADSPAAVVLFYSHVFEISLRMKDLVSELARNYHLCSSGGDAEEGEIGGTVFLAAEAEKCEWLCRRLGVKVLPVVVGYVEGREVGRVVGFEGLGSSEDVSWRGLGWVIGKLGGGWAGTFQAKGQGRSVLGKGWEDWVGNPGSQGNGSRKNDGGSEDDEDERNRRRRKGYIGGGGNSGRLKIGGKQRQNVGADEDDDWD